MVYVCVCVCVCVRVRVCVCVCAEKCNLRMHISNVFYVLCIWLVIGYVMITAVLCFMLCPKWNEKHYWSGRTCRLKSGGGGGAHSHHAPSRLWICFIMRNKPFLAITLLQSSKALAGRLLPCLSLLERSLTTVYHEEGAPNPFFMGTYTLLRLDGAVVP